MKFLSTLAALFIFISMSAFSQDDLDEQVDTLNFSDENSSIELDEEYVEDDPLQPYGGIGFGYTGAFMMLDMDGLEKHLTANNFGVNGEEFSIGTPMYVHGGGVMAAGFWGIKNLSIGFFVNGGSGKDEKELTIDDQTFTRGVDYNLNFNALSFSYGIVLAEHFAILPGVKLGWGDMGVTLYQARKDYAWDTDFNGAGSDNTFMNKAEATFFTAQPMLSLEYNLKQTLTNINLTVGYTTTFSNDWKFNRVGKFKDKEEPSDIQADSPFIQIGIFFGLFGY